MTLTGREKDVWVIVPVADALDNFVMLNNSSSRNFNDVRKNDIGDKWLYEMLLPQNQVFATYQWYNDVEIKIELAKTEWAFDE